jgi:hypothetical protein
MPPAKAPVACTTCPQCSQTAKTKQKTLEDALIKLITNTVAPHSWTDAGGKGTIAFYPLGMALVVSQTAEVQEQVAELLAALRHLQDEEVTLECRFVTVPESMLGKLGHCSPECCLTCAEGCPMAVAKKLSAAGPAQKSPICLDDAEMFSLMEACQRDQHSCVMQAPRITLFNGQNANLSLVDQQFFVTGMTVRWDGQQVVAVPQQESVETGLRMGLRAVISHDRKLVNTELKVKLTELAGHEAQVSPVITEISPVQEDGQPDQAVPFTQFIQKPKVNTVINFDRTFKLAEGKTAIVGAWKKTVEVPVECGPPILREIPVVNWLFDTERYETEKQVVLLMVTPRVIVNNADAVKDLIPSVKEQPGHLIFGVGVNCDASCGTIHTNERSFSVHQPPATNQVRSQESAPQVKEPPTGQLLFGVGVNSDAGLTGHILINERNFDVRRAEGQPATVQVRGVEVREPAPMPKEYLLHPPQYVAPTPPFTLSKEAIKKEPIGPAAAAGPEQNARLAKLLAKYEKACAEGRKDDAKRFANQALKLDPTCFSKKPDKVSKATEPSQPAGADLFYLGKGVRPLQLAPVKASVNEPVERIGVDFNFNPPIFFFGKEVKPLTPERVHGGIQ